jgi:dolichol kinase
MKHQHVGVEHIFHSFSLEIVFVEMFRAQHLDGEPSWQYFLYHERFYQFFWREAVGVRARRKFAFASFSKRIKRNRMKSTPWNSPPVVCCCIHFFLLLFFPSFSLAGH